MPTTTFAPWNIEPPADPEAATPVAANGSTRPSDNRNGIRRAKPFYLTICALLLSTLATVVNIFAADSEEPAAQVKAEMLYEFVSYTKWPEQAFSAEDSPYRVWVLSAEELANTLQNMAAERRPNGRPIEVFKASSPEQISEPHVVFIGRGAEHSPQVEELMKTRSALVITENSNGLKSGSIINLQPADGRVYFEISVENAQKSNLEISSRLLSIASSVEQ